jgi:hypothetical protein
VPDSPGQHDLDLRVNASPHARLAWLNPFWRDDVSFSVPSAPDECRRRLERLAGHPGPLRGGWTAGTVSAEGFRLVARVRSQGFYYAVALTRGRLLPDVGGTRVEARTTYAPQALAWALAIYLLMGFAAVIQPPGSPWRFLMPVLMLVSWIPGCWLNHRYAEALPGRIVLALVDDDPESPAARPLQ